jgi:putative membrane protein
MYIGKLLFHIISGVLGIFLAAKFVPGVEFYGSFLMLLIVGTAIGLVNFFIKPFLKIISLPIRILTLGIFSLIINMAMIWLVEIVFPKELEITGLIPLFWTTLIVGALNLFFGLNKKSWKK